MCYGRFVCCTYHLVRVENKTTIEKLLTFGTKEDAVALKLKEAADALKVPGLALPSPCDRSKQNVFDRA